MRFSVWVSTGWSWTDILRVSREVGAGGWDGIWVPDHFMPPATGYGQEPNPSDDPELEPVHEAWTTVTALAALVSGARLGVLVSGNTYRHPALVAKMAATIDHVCEGRFTLGLGAGWQENEHNRYGIPFPGPRERSDRLEEAATVISRLFAESRARFDGDHYTLDEAPLEPKPVQQPMPLLIGGKGEQRTMRTAARYATHWNCWGTPDTMRHKVDVLRSRCEEVGREPGEVAVSANAFLAVLESSTAADGLRRKLGDRGGLVGTPAELRHRIAQYEEAGVSELVIAGFSHSPRDLVEMLRVFDDEVRS